MLARQAPTPMGDGTYRGRRAAREVGAVRRRGTSRRAGELGERSERLSLRAAEMSRSRTNSSCSNEATDAQAPTPGPPGRTNTGIFCRRSVSAHICASGSFGAVASQTMRGVPSSSSSVSGSRSMSVRPHSGHVWTQSSKAPSPAGQYLVIVKPCCRYRRDSSWLGLPGTQEEAVFSTVATSPATGSPSAPGWTLLGTMVALWGYSLQHHAGARNAELKNLRSASPPSTSDR